MKRLVSQSDVTNLIRVSQIINDVSVDPENNLKPGITLALNHSKTHGYLLEFNTKNSEGKGILVPWYAKKDQILQTLKLYFSNE